MDSSNDRLLRVPQILGQKEVTPEQANANRKAGKSPRTARPYIEPLLPISRASWWAGVKAGRYPQPVKLSSRTTCWRESDVLALIAPRDKSHE